METGYVFEIETINTVDGEIPISFKNESFEENESNNVTKLLIENLNLNKAKLEASMFSIHVVCLEQLLQYFDSNVFCNAPYMANPDLMNFPHQ